MFRGSIPSVVSQLADEHMQAWKARTVYVGCSGAFTVERHLSKYGLELHSNDVLLYSAAIGGYCSGKPYPLELTEAGARDLPWVDEKDLKEPTAALATMLLVSKFAMAVGRKDNHETPYYVKLRQAYETQWDRMHGDMVERLGGLDLKLASYTSEDVMTWLDRVPEDAAVVAYPPFQAAGAASYFAKDFAELERTFVWDTPDYTALEDDALDSLYEKIADREEWLFAVNRPVPSLSEHLRAVAQTTNRAPKIHVYGSGGPRRRVQPHQSVEPIKVPHIGPDEEIGDRLTVHLLTGPQFQALRSVYMNAGIRPGAAQLPFAVCVDGKLIGSFAYSGLGPTAASWDAHLPQPSCYLLSDFPVSASKYDRLAKLVIMAALSTETRALILRYGKKPFRSMTTTAISKNPVSMKYRGVLKLVKREENDSFDTDWGRDINDGDAYYSRPWKLQYGSELGLYTLDEALAEWKKRHAKALKKRKSQS